MKRLSYLLLLSAFFYFGCGPSEEEVQQQEEATQETVQDGQDLIEQMAAEQSEDVDTTSSDVIDSTQAEATTDSPE